MRRLAAAALSALIPGLGQLFNGRRRLAALFLIPSLILLALGALIVSSQSPARVWPPGSSRPRSSARCSTLNVLVLAWRLVAVGQAFLDTRPDRTDRPAGDRRPRRDRDPGGPARTSPSIATGRSWATRSIASSPARSWAPPTIRGANAGPVPGDGERVNVLIVGSDKRGKRTANLTDTMMVASLDPVGHTRVASCRSRAT